MLDEWLFRQNEEPIHLFVERQSNHLVSGDPLYVFQFRHNAERLRSITFDLRSDLGDFQALQKTFADLQRLKPPSLARFFIQCSDAYAPKKQAQPSYDSSPQAKRRTLSCPLSRPRWHSPMSYCRAWRSTGLNFQSDTRLFCLRRRDPPAYVLFILCCP